MDTLDSVERYFPRVDQWEKCTVLPAQRDLLAAVTLGGDLYAIGGRDEGVCLVKPGRALVVHTARPPHNP